MPRLSQQVEFPRLAAGVSGEGSADGKSQGDGPGGVKLRSTTQARLSPATVEADAHEAGEQ